MKESLQRLDLLWNFFQKLRVRRFELGIDDYMALHRSLQAGFGWSSRQVFLELCISLWAKSRSEQETLSALFEQLMPSEEQWIYVIPQDQEQQSGEQSWTRGETINRFNSTPKESAENTSGGEVSVSETRGFLPQTEVKSGLPPISIQGVKVAEQPFLFVPQLPVTYREVAQTWRRLKRPIRLGAPTELDLAATLERRCRLGVGMPVVLRPRQRNVSRLLLLVDRQGSMTPFDALCTEVCEAIQKAGRLGETAIYYFHNVPAAGADDRILKNLNGQLFPVLDSILPQIPPLLGGYLYTDRSLLEYRPLQQVLEDYGRDAFIMIVSDGGAARQSYRISRLLDTIAFMKGLRTYSSNYVWLNPLPRNYWQNTTAGQIARHVPMFAMNREEMETAVNVLRGQQYGDIMERPL
jgi:uncharacterized protein